MTPRSPLAMLAAVAVLSACVAEDGFPSLAPRPGERDLSTEEPERQRVQVADDAALRGRIADLREEAAEGQRAFAAEFPAAAAAVAAAAARETDSWVSAQQALSRLEAARTPISRTMAELDRLAIDRAGEPTSDADFALIREAIADVARIAAGQQERMDALRGRLGRR